MSTPTKTITTAAIATTLAALFVARNYKDNVSPYVDRDVLQDVLLTFGGLIVGGVALGGVKDANSVGRGLLWGAGGLATTWGIDKVLLKK